METTAAGPEGRHGAGAGHEALGSAGMGSAHGDADAAARLRELGLLVAKLVHELRNPLDGALRFLNLALSARPGEERWGRYLLAARDGLERIQGIVEGFMALSCCGQPGNGAAAEVNGLIVQALGLQEDKARQRGVKVELGLGDGLPPVPDGAGLFQVFTNLVSNALDAMESGGGTLSVSSWRENGAVVVRVADTGHGMTPEVLGCIFRPFFTTKPPGRGMGLGLAVCREVLDRLGGRIDVCSTPGQGSVFLVTVPCGPIQG